MKNISVRIPRCVPLFLSLLCAGIALSLPFTFQAQPPQADWRFTVEQGKSISVSLLFNNPCAAPHRFSMSSKEKFLRFEEPTDSVLLEPGSPKGFAARIEATGLKPKVYDAKLDVECLDCKEDPKCGQLRKEFVVEVTVIEASAQTQQGNTQTGAPGANPSQGDRETRLLSAEGPQLPQTFDQSNFKFTGFVKGNSPLLFDYELEQPGYVILTIIVKKKILPPFIYKFQGTSAGRHEELIRLPSYLGGGPAPSVAAYSIKAVSETFRPIVVIIHGLSVGAEAIGSSGLDRLTFEPRDIQVVGGEPATNASYSFRAVRPFNGGAKAYVRLLNGRSSTEVSNQSYTRNIGAGEVISGTWDCKKGGRPSLGKHLLFVKAWFTVQEGGAFAFASSPQVLVRR